MRYSILAAILWLQLIKLNAQTPALSEVMRVGVAGMSHDHIGFLLNKKRAGIEVVGVWEPNKEMALRYAKKFQFDTSIIYTDLKKMLDATKPEVVAAFG